MRLEKRSALKPSGANSPSSSVIWPGPPRFSQKLDPEELRDLMQLYQRACDEVVERYEGHVAQYLGDGLLVYFGWPEAFEDDPVRAAGLRFCRRSTTGSRKGSTPAI